MSDEGGIDVYLGLDVGKGEHHATALTPAGKKVFDKPLPNNEPKLRELFTKLQAKHGTVLVVVDQPASDRGTAAGRRPRCGCRVAYLPGLTMRRIADLYPGEAKTDARDATIIADAARTMPHTLRDLAPADETVAELDMLVGFDDDLAGEVDQDQEPSAGPADPDPPLTRASPGPSSGPSRRAAPARTLRLPGPVEEGRHGDDWYPLLRPKAPRMAERLVEDIFAALDEQTVVVPGTDAAALIVPSLGCLAHRRPRPAPTPRRPDRGTAGGPPSFPGPDLDARHRGQDRRPDPHRRRRRQRLPHGRPPGRLRRPGTRHPPLRLLDPRRTPRPGAATNSSNVPSTSPRSPRSPRPESRAYYDRKRREGKHHVAALVCLARRRIDVLFAMLRDGTFYEAPTHYRCLTKTIGALFLPARARSPARHGRHRRGRHRPVGTQPPRAADPTHRLSTRS